MQLNGCKLMNYQNSWTTWSLVLFFWPFMISVSLAFTPHAPSNPPFFYFLSVSVSDSFTCPQGSARSGWKLFRRPRNPPSAAPRSAPTASPTTPLQTSEARWSSVVTKAECWCPWRGVKSGSAKQNRYFQHRRDFLSIGWRLPVWKSRVIFAVFLKQMKQSWRCSWETQKWPWMCNAENKYIYVWKSLWAHWGILFCIHGGYRLMLVDPFTLHVRPHFLTN